jgi:hypothetical protein
MRATYLMMGRLRPERFVSGAEGLALERAGDACRARSGVCVSDWKLHKCYATHTLGWVSVRSTRRSGQVGGEKLERELYQLRSFRWAQERGAKETD